VDHRIRGLRARGEHLMSGEALTDRSTAASMGRLTFAAWREQALARAMEMENLLNWLEKKSHDEYKKPLVKAVRDHLEAARESAHTRATLRGTISGSVVERTTASLDAAQIHLLRLAPLDYLRSYVPSLFAEAQEQLDGNDLRLMRLKRLADQANVDQALTEPERSDVIAAIQSTMAEARHRQMRVRTFRNVIWFTTAAILALTIIVAFIGFINPTMLPLCFSPESRVVVCPTHRSFIPATGAGVNDVPSPSAQDEATRRSANPRDIALVEFVGLLGAAVAATAALRRMRGTADPYSLPVALATLKLPLGALIAFLALLLIRAQFVPGLSALDSSAQIIAWSLIFGYSQELFTRAVDRQAAAVLQGTAPTGTTQSPDSRSTEKS
jgi:hypothetical protein